MPIIGDTLSFLRSPSAFLAERRERYGPVFWSNVIGMKTVTLLGPEANRWIFAGENEYLVNRWSYAIRKLLGERCLSLLDGEAHRERRRILAPHFRRTGMDPLVPLLVETTQKHLRTWADAEGETIVLHRMKALAFEIAARYIFGDVRSLDLNTLSADFDDFVAGLFSPVPLPLPLTTFGRATAARKRLFRVIGRVVAERKRLDVEGVDVLSTLLSVRDEQGQPLPEDTIVDELVLLLFAGHDTTVTVMTNVMLHLAQHPDVLARAQSEQDALRDAPMTVASFRRMRYLERVLNESMRVVPPIAGAFRVTTRDVAYGGYRIPKGWTVIVSMAGAAHDPEVWGDVESFDPERFDDDTAPARPPFSFIPFGGGPRVCLGQHFAMLEMLVVTSRILRDYSFSLVPDQDLSYVYLPFPRPRSGVRIHLEPRRVESRAPEPAIAGGE